MDALKRCIPGLLLIGLTSATLLLSDLEHRRRISGPIKRVALVQHASQPLLDDGVAGIIAGLGGAGFVNGQTIVIQRFNAENDIATANAIAKQVAEGGFDLIITASTLSLQTVANANRDGRTPHVFTLVADPPSAGVGISRENPLQHPKHLTGVGSFVPVAPVFELAKKLNPSLKSVGLVWNSAESNSEAYTKKSREACAALGLQLMEATVENSSGVSEAASALVARGADALFVSGDVTVLVATEAVVAAARRGGIPVFSAFPPSVEKGTLFDVGADFFEIGKESGAMAASVLKGADPVGIPWRNSVPRRILVNKLALKGLRQAWTIPDSLLADAETVIDETGKHSKARRGLGRTWRIALLEYNNILDVEDCRNGVLSGLKDAGLAEGTDYQVSIQNAQGDMAAVTAIVDNALGKKVDLLITLSTPTLQSAIQRVKQTPIVFTYVANGVIAGAGRSSTDHLPNVTGVDFTAPYNQMLPLMRQLAPSAKRIGTIFTPSEVNSVYMKDELVEFARQNGMELVTVPASTSAEVPDAALALASSGIDAIVQIPGNLTAASFASIARAARNAKLPVFAFQSTQAHEGAPVVIARDYADAGKEAAKIAVRIMRGEDPAKIPIHSVSRTRLILNLPAAESVGLHIPAELVGKAVEVIR